MTTLQVIEIVRRLDQGMTRPFLVRAEDDALYIAKGRETTQRGLMAEWIDFEAIKRRLSLRAQLERGFP